MPQAGTPSDKTPSSTMSTISTPSTPAPAPVAVKPPRLHDRPTHLKRRLLLAIPLVVMPAANWLLGLAPGLVESVYTNGVGQAIGRMLAAITSPFPFSVAELLLCAIIAWLLFIALRAAVHVIRGTRRAANAAICGLAHFASVCGILVFMFYTAWGFNYARAGIITRMHWQDFAKTAQEKTDADALARLCEELVAAGNRDYESATGARDLERPSTLPMSTSELNKRIDAAYVRVAERLRLDPTFAVSRGRAKPVFFSFVMSDLLILGVYSPWTGEANYNRKMPECRWPEVIGHEKAHQRAITSEDEANFFGYLACIHSDDPYLRYSGCLMAQRQLIPELHKRDPARAKAILKQRFPGVQRDADAVEAFRRAHLGPVSAAGNAVNNAYLKANRVAQGAKSYQLSAQLILTFAQINNGSCLAPTPK